MRVVLLLIIAYGFCIIATEGEEDACLSADSFDYGDALGKAILFFEGQRSGKLPSTQRIKWRGDSPLTDGRLENIVHS